MIDKSRSVLVVVDIQPDFLPGGALGINHGDQILAPLRVLMESNIFKHLVATQDWHPPGHISFASSHPHRKPMDEIPLYGQMQTLWPDHCVQGSAGAKLHGDLPWERVCAIVRKGMDPQVDSYSAFRNNWDANGERPPTGLTGYLRDRGVDNVYMAGLARDFCVRYSSRDAAAAGFNTYVLWDLTRPVDKSSDEAVRKEMEEQGIRVIDSAHLQ